MSTLSFGERVARSAWRVTPSRTLSNIIGWYARRHVPSSFLRSFARKYGIDVDEAEKAIEEYDGLQDFFTRRLRPGARPVDATPGVVVCPADGKVVDCGIVAAGQRIEAKGIAFTLGELLGDADLARSFEGGAFQVTYLSPRDYHRVHAPVAGKITAWHYMPGTLFPVNDASVRREPGLFAKNERFVTVIDSKADSEAGLCAVVMVAAVGVGHITATYDVDVATHASGFGSRKMRHKRMPTPVPIARGGEVGIFNLGSTTIVLFEAGRVRLDEAAPGTAVRMGQPLGRVAA